MSTHNITHPIDLIIFIEDFGMARSLNSEYYKTDDTLFPVKWSSPEVLNYGKFSVQSGILFIDDTQNQLFLFD